MGLLDLRTNLRDLKFGNDRQGGGSSDSPYIVTPIPDNTNNILNFDEGLVRGGVLGAAKAVGIDTLRIFKFFKDLPKGPLFITKQVGLQLSNPRIETNSGLFNNLNIGPTRIYNLGINTLAQVPVGAFGAHITRHGLTPIQNESTKYESVVKNKLSEDNRLVQLRDRLILRNEKLNLNKKDNKSIGRILSQFNIDALSSGINIANYITVKLTKQNSVIDRYIGGPGSVYGVGNTTIRRFDYTPAINDDASKYFDEIRKQNQDNLFSTNNLLLLDSSLDLNLSASIRRNTTIDINSVTPDDNEDVKIISKDNYNTEQKVLKEGDRVFFIDTRINRGSPGVKKDRSDYSKGFVLDKITALPIFRATSPGGNNDVSLAEQRDLIKFRFEAIDTDSPNFSNFIVFRAFLKGITLPFNADWQGIKYNGRGENFYVYNGFSSAISFNFQLAAQSRLEMKPMYQKLNYLISNLTPDYGSGNRMRGPMMKLTIGNLIYRQPGFITSLTPTVNDDAPWEIALNEPDDSLGEDRKDTDMMELPHLIDVSVSFTPIWNFLPQKSLTKSPFIADKGNEVATGQRWIPNTKLL